MTTTEQLAAALRALLDEAPAGTIAESVLYEELRGMHDRLPAAREALARFDAERAQVGCPDTFGGTRGPSTALRGSYPEVARSPYARRVRELEAEGCTTSDAQSIADAEGLEDWA